MGSYENEYKLLWELKETVLYADAVIIFHSYKYNVATANITYCDICLFHKRVLNE